MRAMSVRAAAITTLLSSGILVGGLATPASAAATVTSFTPSTGPVGTAVTITGTGFTGSGGTCTSMTVTFNGTSAKCTYVSATQIKTAVPASAITGPLKVNGVAAASNPTFTVTLGISMSPTVGRPKTPVTISGSGYDPYSAVDVYFDSTDEQLVLADAGGTFSVTNLFNVPASAVPGNHWVSAVERGATPRGAQKSFRVATSWSESGFDSQHTSNNPVENVLSPSTVDGLNEDWVFPTDGYLDRSSPTVAGGTGANGTVFVGQQSGSGRLYAVDAKTGKETWHSSGSASIGGSLVYGSRVFVTAGASLQSYPLTCSTPCAATGTWGSFLLGDPVLSGTNILISDTNGVEVYPTSCGATCSPAWSGYGNLTSAFPVSSPAVAASGRFFASGHDMTTWDGRLEAYNAAGCGNPNCPPVWDANLGSEWDASVHTPVVSNGSVYVTGDDTRVYAFKVGGCAASPCAPRWTFDRGINIGTTPAVSHGVVYVAGDLGLEALDAGTGALLWHGDLPSVSDESSPVVANGVVYVTSGDRGTSSELWAFPASCSGTCAPLWHSVVSATGYASPPVVVNGTVYDASGDGGLYAYDQNDPITPAARPRLSALTPDRSLSRIPG